MSVFLRRGLLVVLTALVPVGADACCLLNPFNTCGTCRSRPWIGFTFGLPLPCCAPCGPRPCPPPCGPVCPPPCGPVCPPYGYGPSLGVGPSLVAPVPAAYNCDPVPVCTTLEPQQVTTYQTVPTTQIRREAYVENVPVTTYQQITVPRTVYQPQTRYRDVAYTVNQQVARTHTQYVPRPVAGYRAPLPVSTGCATCDQATAYGAAPQVAARPAYTPAPYIGGATSSIPTPIALPRANPQTSHAAKLQQPQPYAESRWQTVPQRQAQDNTEIQQMGGFYPSYSPPPQQASRASMFQPAPSAATVWQTRWMR